MTLYSAQERQVEMVEVSVRSSEGWSVQFSPPHPGIAHLSVMVEGKHIRKHSVKIIIIMTKSNS